MSGWWTIGVAELPLLVGAMPAFTTGPPPGCSATRTQISSAPQPAFARSGHLARAPPAGPRDRAGAPAGKQFGRRLIEIMAKLSDLGQGAGTSGMKRGWYAFRGPGRAPLLFHQ